jgi:hypothetical protein
VRKRLSCPLRGALRSLTVAQGLLANVPNVPSKLARLRGVRLHVIGAEAEFEAMHDGKRQDPTGAFLSEMHAFGARSGAAWLADNLDAVGMRSSLDLPLFAGPVRNTSTGTLAA